MRLGDLEDVRKTAQRIKKALACGHCYSHLSVVVMNTSLCLLTGRADTERGQHRPGLVSSAAVILGPSQPAKARHSLQSPGTDEASQSANRQRGCIS